jgi:hypothetical protein
MEPRLELETAFAVIAGVLVVSALAPILVERAPLSFPMLFLGLGFLIGDRGLELVSIGLDNQVLEVVAVVTLALVLFLDAVNLELTEQQRPQGSYPQIFWSDVPVDARRSSSSVLCDLFDGLAHEPWRHGVQPGRVVVSGCAGGSHGDHLQNAPKPPSFGGGQNRQ